MPPKASKAAPKPRRGRSSAKAVAPKVEPGVASGSQEGAIAASPATATASFNASHFQAIRQMKKEILEHEVFAGIEGELPLGITGVQQSSGRQAPRPATHLPPHLRPTHILVCPKVSPGTVHADRA